MSKTTGTNQNQNRPKLTRKHQKMLEEAQARPGIWEVMKLHGYGRDMAQMVDATNKAAKDKRS